MFPKEEPVISAIHHRCSFVVALTLMLSCLLTAYAADAAARYTHGFKLYQYHLDYGVSVEDDPIPAAELGAFVAKKSEYNFEEAIKAVGVLTKSPRLFRAVGYLNVTTPSTYTIIMTARDNPYMYASIFVNKAKVAGAQGYPLSLTAPVSFKEPGVYEIDIRLYAHVTEKLVTREYGGSPRLDSFNILIKAPDNDTQQPAHKVLLLPLK